jgi:hypothetical protein
MTQIILISEEQGMQLFNTRNQLTLKLPLHTLDDKILIYFGPYGIVVIYIAVCQVIPDSTPLQTRS